MQHFGDCRFPNAPADATNTMIEPLEQRQMLSASPAGAAARAAAHAPAGISQAPVIRRKVLTKNEVSQILAAAASQARKGQVIAVTDRDGNVLGVFGVGSIDGTTIAQAVTRARTAAFFQSRQDAFTTRTARFIVQDRFPFPVPNTPGGPLYGVQFSSLAGSDVLPEGFGSSISGDPGGIPLYKGAAPVGGIGVAGDGDDVCVRADLVDDDRVCPAENNPKDRSFTGQEESDFDEAVALAGAQGFMAPESIRATRIFVDGLRFPFTADQPARAKPSRSLDDLIDRGVGNLLLAPAFNKDTAEIVSPPKETHPTATIGGSPGHILNDITGSDDKGEHLNKRDVKRIIANAVRTALKNRAIIRRPIGVHIVLHIAVTDRDGDLLGVFRMKDATRFSYDVAVQKARTAAFFSDDRHAFTPRGIGFLSQGFFPVGIEDETPGPLYQLQNDLSLEPGNFKGRLKNGITIFPGGEPLYKHGKLVGAIGVSGDGVDQDDLASFGGTVGFRPDRKIRSDSLSDGEIVRFLRKKVDFLADRFNLTDELINDMNDRLDDGLFGVTIPYVKFPRNPQL